MTDEDGAETDSPSEGGPDESELPDEPVSVGDLDPFERDSAEFDDINAFATTEWTESTTARERVRAVVKRTREPKTASEIADVAAVSETATRNALEDLTEEGPVRTERTSVGAVYRRNPDWYLLQRVQRLSHSDRLVDRIRDLQEELNEYQDRYGTESPEELLVSEEALSKEALEDVSEWRTAKRDLSFLRAAYRFREAKEATVMDFDTAAGNEDTSAVPN